MAAEVSDKTPPPEAHGDSKAGGGGTASVEKTFMTVSEAQKFQAEKNDPKTEIARSKDTAEKGAVAAVHSEVGDGRDIANNPAVRASVEGARTLDPNLKANGNDLNFPALQNASLKDLARGNDNSNPNASRDIPAAAGAGMAADAQIARPRDVNTPQDRFTPAGADGPHKVGDNNVRDVNPQTDNPQAVTQRYGDMVDHLAGLPPGEAQRMKDQFSKDMEKTQEKFKGDDLSHIMRSMNLMMDGNNHLGSDKNRVNAVSGLAARGANPEEANRQGANPTCALTSESRIEQERNFVKYADQMGSVAAQGGAWRGGENGTQPTWINVDAAGTNHANFQADAESSKMYDPAYHQAAGHRDYLGQLDNAVVGGEMAHYAGQRDGKDYVYVAANAGRVPGTDSFGQGSTGGALMERAGGGQLTQAQDGGKGVEGPPSTLDMVAAVNQANGGGGSFIQRDLAAQFRKPDGSYPPGMNVFNDAADLRQQLANKQPPGQEFQILTNGVIVAGKEGHGLHAQEVKLNGQGQLEFGNNWDDAHNHKVYDDKFVNTFTNPTNWDNYHPQHTMPDGVTPDWRREHVGPNTADIVPRSSMTDNPANKKPDDDQDKNKKKPADDDDPEKKKEEQDKQTKAKQHQVQQAAHDQWQARREAFMSKNPGQDFSESEPPMDQ